VDVSLSLLALPTAPLPSAPLRDAVEAVFRAFCDVVTATGADADVGMPVRCRCARPAHILSTGWSRLGSRVWDWTGFVGASSAVFVEGALQYRVLRSGRLQTPVTCLGQHVFVMIMLRCWIHCPGLEDMLRIVARPEAGGGDEVLGEDGDEEGDEADMEAVSDADASESEDDTKEVRRNCKGNLVFFWEGGRGAETSVALHGLDRQMYRQKGRQMHEEASRRADGNILLVCCI
jgi:hypothetical protein